MKFLNQAKHILTDRRGKFGEEDDHALTLSEKRYKDKLKAEQERLARKNGASDFSWMSTRKTGNLGGNILKEPSNIVDYKSAIFF